MLTAMPVPRDWLPIPNCYWVLKGNLLAGEYPASESEPLSAQRLSGFLEAGVRSFLDLTSPGELLPYEGLLARLAADLGTSARHLQFPILDRGTPSPSLMTSILDTIDAELGAGRKVYVHCWGGVGRTGTVVGCYLVRHGATGREALRQLSDWWQNVPKSAYHPRSPETDEQVDYILSWNNAHI